MHRRHDRVNSKMHRCNVDPTGRILAITYGGFVGPQEMRWSIFWHHALDEENAGAVDIKLSDDDIARLEAALRPESVSGPRYNEKAMAWVDR
jgi:hypothetical protein